ncbi:hypothetical protein EGW08_012768 [Elysia chlorotica]|uniref:Uncharacterized protein n=1 Tax=Elysia chlorotica TaxID=188477 RepID=A0A3S0ZP49_ELYCH|nr:hypothetical protein EGW08_012768 [Elysia chlorotica]
MSNKSLTLELQLLMSDSENLHLMGVVMLSVNTVCIAKTLMHHSCKTGRDRCTQFLALPKWHACAVTRKTHVPDSVSKAVSGSDPSLSWHLTLIPVSLEEASLEITRRFDRRANTVNPLLTSFAAAAINQSIKIAEREKREHFEDLPRGIPPSSPVASRLVWFDPPRHNAGPPSATNGARPNAPAIPRQLSNARFATRSAVLGDGIATLGVAVFSIDIIGFFSPGQSYGLS